MSRRREVLAEFTGLDGIIDAGAMAQEIESLRAQLEAQSGEAEEDAYLCSNCGPIAHTEVDALDQTLGCTRCNGVMWGDNGITIEPLYTSPPAAKVPEGFITVPTELIEEYIELLEGAKYKAIHSRIRIDMCKEMISAQEVNP